MSAGPDRYQSRKRSPIASRSTLPRAVTSAMQTAIEVSSVHSPGAKSPSPPPIIAISPCGERSNS
jgi:hypothetical protein